MEVAARLGGGHDAELCEAALGVDLNGLAIDAALGRPGTGASAGARARRGRGGDRVPRRAAGHARGGRGRRRRAGERGGALGADLPARRATSSRRSGAAPTGRARCSRRARAARRRWSGLAVRRTPYASGSMRTRRDTRLGFQPPAIGEEEVAAVAETLRSGWLTTGPRAAELEQRLAEYLEVEHVLAVSSGTAAMHLALVALGVGPGDEVITLADHVARDRERDRARGRDPGVLRRPRGRPQPRRGAPPRARHRADEGDPARAPRRPAVRPRRAARARASPVVEDAAHALESRYRGRKVGGALRRDLLLALRDQEPRGRRGGPRRDEPRADVAEAIGRDAAHAPRRRCALRPGDRGLQGEPLRRARGDRARPARQARAARRAPPRGRSRSTTRASPTSTGSRRSPATRATRTRTTSTSSGSIPSRAGATRDEYQRALAEERISTSIHFLPVHRLTWFRERYPAQPPLPVAERAGEEVLSLPALAGALRRRHPRRGRRARGACTRAFTA